MHSHYYLGKTTIDDRHWHNYEGVTSCDPDEPGHIHYMNGKTSLEDGHVHEYRNATGPAIYVRQALPHVLRHHEGSRRPRAQIRRCDTQVLW